MKNVYNCFATVCEFTDQTIQNEDSTTQFLCLTKSVLGFLIDLIIFCPFIHSFILLLKTLVNNYLPNIPKRVIPLKCDGFCTAEPIALLSVHQEICPIQFRIQGMVVTSLPTMKISFTNNSSPELLPLFNCEIVFSGSDDKMGTFNSSNIICIS